MATPTCSACGTEMQIGFVPEATLGGFFVSVWHPGDATRDGKTLAQRVASPAGVRYAGADVLAIDAWRCSGCGRVDLFATRPPDKGESL